MKNNNSSCFNSNIFDRKVVKLFNPVMHLQIKETVYLKVHKNGCYQLMSSNETILKNGIHDNKSLFNITTKYIKKIKLNSLHFSIFDNELNELSKEYIKGSNNFGILCILRQRDKCEIFFFIHQDRNKNNIANFLLQNRHLIKRYIQYFRINLKNLCTKNNDPYNKFKNSILHNEFNYEVKNTLYEVKPSEKFFFYKNNLFTELTYKETICLYYLNQGISNKEISQRMIVSSKRVDCLIRSTKNKLGVNSKSELIEIMNK